MQYTILHFNGMWSLFYGLNRKELVNCNAIKGSRIVYGINGYTTIGDGRLINQWLMPEHPVRLRLLSRGICLLPDHFCATLRTILTDYILQ